MSVVQESTQPSSAHQCPVACRRPSARNSRRPVGARSAARWSLLSVIVLTWTIVVRGSSLLAETVDAPVPQATPAELGLVLPQAAPLPGDGRRVLVSQNDQDPEVAEVYLEVGDRFVLMLSDGHLISVPQQETTPTDRPFKPIDKEQLAKQLVETRFPGFRVYPTRHYVCIYNTSEPFREATSRILETMYPALEKKCRRWKLPVQAPRFPLVVVMFRTQEEYQKYRAVPEGVVAYYNVLSNHVVLYEQSTLTEVAPELAFKQSISTIAHEGVHQILHNIGIQQRLSSWPVWFSEGLAEYFAPTDVGRNARWKGLGLVNDLRLYELSEFYKAREGRTTDGDLLRKTVEANTMDSLGYATSWALIHYAARTNNEKFGDCMREVSEIGPLQSIRSGVLFTKHIANDYSKLEDELIQYLQALPYTDPIVNQTHYVLMIQHENRRETLVTASPARVMRHQREREKNSVVMVVKVFPNQSSAQLFAKTWESRK